MELLNKDMAFKGFWEKKVEDGIEYIDIHKINDPKHLKKLVSVIVKREKRFIEKFKNDIGILSILLLHIAERCKELGVEIKFKGSPLVLCEDTCITFEINNDLSSIYAEDINSLIHSNGNEVLKE